MSIQLRPYQKSLIADVRRVWDAAGLGFADKAVLLQLATGAGKTVLGMHLSAVMEAEHNPRRQPGPALWVVHRRELLDQTVDTAALFGLSWGVVAARNSGWAPPDRWATPQPQVVVAMVQSLHRRLAARNGGLLDQYAPIGGRRPVLVVADEAHHIRAKSWMDIVHEFAGVPLLGLTATPERLDGKGLGGEHGPFDRLIEGPSVQDLITDGYLADIRQYSLPTPAGLAQVKRNPMTGDYHWSKYEREHHGEAQQLYGQITADAVEQYRRYAFGKTALFFAVNRNHSRAVAAEFNREGISAAHVDGNTPRQERDRIMAALKAGELKVVTNCEIITEGFDAPMVDAVLMGRPTKSIVVFLQQAGRAMRPRDGKTALILDLVGNIRRLKSVKLRRDWSLEEGGAPAESTDIECPRCHMVCPQNTAACPGCGFSFDDHKRCPKCGDWVDKAVIRCRCGHLFITTPPKPPETQQGVRLVEVIDPDNPAQVLTWRQTNRAVELAHDLWLTGHRREAVAALEEIRLRSRNRRGEPYEKGWCYYKRKEWIAEDVRRERSRRTLMT